MIADLIYIQPIREVINFDFGKWNIMQSNANTTEEIKIAGNYLCELMRKATTAEEEETKLKKKANRLNKSKEGFYRYSKPEKPDHQGYFSYFYQTNDDKEFFFYDSPLNKKIVEYLIDNDKVRYVGRIKHQGTDHKAWTYQNDIDEINANIDAKQQLKNVLKDKELKKTIIKNAISLRLQYDGDYLINWLFHNRKFRLITEGVLDWEIKQGKKTIIIHDNINEEFICAINELLKEKIIDMRRPGHIFMGANFKKETIQQLEGNISSDYIFQDRN